MGFGVLSPYTCPVLQMKGNFSMFRSTCLALLIFTGIAAADVQTGVVRSGDKRSLRNRNG